MKNNDFESTLSFREIIMLFKCLHKKGNFFSYDEVRFLRTNGLIKPDSLKISSITDKPVDTTYNITEKGHRYLTHKFREKITYWVPIIISNITSIIALIVSLTK